MRITELCAQGRETLLDGPAMVVQQGTALVVVDAGFVDDPPLGSLLQ